VTNNGPQVAKNVVISDTLPVQEKFLSFVQARIPLWNCTYKAAKRLATCTLKQTLPVHHTVKVGINVQVLTRPPALKNCAAVSAKPSDPYTGDNLSCLTLDQNLQPVTSTGADLGEGGGSINWLNAIWQTLTGWMGPSRPQARLP